MTVGAKRLVNRNWVYNELAADRWKKAVFPARNEMVGGQEWLRLGGEWVAVA